MSRMHGIQRLEEVVAEYASSLKGLRDTIGMGPAQLACMSWEERARKKLLEAIAKAEESGLVDRA